MRIRRLARPSVGRYYHRWEGQENTMAGRRAITRDMWDALVAQARQTPGMYKIMARAAGLTERTVKLAWTLGFTYGPKEFRRPIKDIIAEEQQIARARLQEQEQETMRQAAEAEARRRTEIAEKDRKDRTESRVQEGTMVRAARGNLLALYAMSAPIASKLAQLGKNVAASLEAYTGLGPDGKPKQMTLAEISMVTRLWNTYTMGQRQLNEAAARSMEMERLLLGQPQHIVGVQLESLTMVEAQRRVSLAASALDRLRARGMVIDATVEQPPQVQLQAHVEPAQPLQDDVPLPDPIPIRRTGTVG